MRKGILRLIRPWVLIPTLPFTYLLACRLLLDLTILILKKMVSHLAHNDSII